MQKISSIIPSSPRTASVDIKEAGPVRSSAPGFGRDQASVSQRAPMPQSTAERSVELMREQRDWRSQEQRQAEMAREVSNQFFMKPIRVPSPVEQVQDDLAPQPASPDPASGATSNAAPEGLFPRGYFLDRSA